MSVLQRDLDAVGRIDWFLWCIDGSNVRSHKPAAGVGKKLLMREPADHALGRSRGGWGTKLHLVTDGAGLPLAIKLSPGPTHESLYAEPLLESVRICRPSGTVRQRPDREAGDKCYSHHRIRQWLRKYGIRAVILERIDQMARHRGRPLKFDAEQYRGRNVAERSIGWLKEARAVATRFERLALHYLASIKLIMRHLYLRNLSNTP